MKKLVTSNFLLSILVLAISITAAKAQKTPPTKAMHYADFVTANPNADADVKLVTDYVNNLIGGNIDKAMASVTSGYWGYGPGPGDSTNVQQTTDTWKQNYTTQQNRKVEFVAETFNVKMGDQAGHWVSTWGTYSFTENGKDVKFPYQYTAHVKNGKIDKDVIYYDQLYILKTLGYTVTPPGK
jgi:hypothetical protein